MEIEKSCDPLLKTENFHDSVTCYAYFKRQRR
ncbi:hypothetical protein T05_6690 [Trichinella murrelli]|uniref:Uncharacterized protein n=1 Tax=Trichinella murrelli TaxID=144512 RepID=A0A0V0T0N5_9BILA|nr:hypothetical protein T05_6690 [Trichinella murrelli]